MRLVTLPQGEWIAVHLVWQDTTLTLSDLQREQPLRDLLCGFFASGVPMFRRVSLRYFESHQSLNCAGRERKFWNVFKPRGNHGVNA